MEEVLVMIFKLISECSDCDFKIELEEKKPKSWLKTVSAFSNGIGGSLFFGVDNNKNLIGLKNPQKDCEKISELINNKITPVPKFILTPYRENDKVFVRLKILPGPSTPYYYSSDGGREVYIRSGNQSIIAPSYILEELKLLIRCQLSIKKEIFHSLFLKQHFMKKHLQE